jgi:enoyl-CoA hydratase
MAYQTIIYEKTEGMGILTLNRPQQLNALSPELCAEAREVLEQAARDEEVRVVIITGGEKVFSAGADIKALQREGILSVALQELDFINGLEGYEKPLIAAVSGYALGGGCELALACDLRIASTTAQFGLPEVKIGLFPSSGGVQRLARLIGIAKAKEMAFSGEPIDAQEAYRLNLVNKVVAVESLMAETQKLARSLIERPPLALRVIKRSIDTGIQMDITSALEYDRRGLYVLAASEDAREGVTAFIEKRKPVFRGR